MTLGDVVQSLTPRSAFTIAGGYGMNHFTDDSENLINSQLITVQGGYSYLLNRRDQVAVVYGFQELHFPQEAGGSVDSQVVNLRWSHTVTGRMSLMVGAGPQYVSINNPVAPTTSRWSLSGRARLRYKLNKSSISLGYEKYTSPGSGFFAGADTQVARLSWSRPLGRTWEFLGDAGYSHSKRIQQLGTLGVAGSYYNDGFAGAVLHKQIGRSYGVFAAYRFSDLAFDRSFCPNASSACSRITRRNIASIGVDWHPRPVRIE